MKRESVESRKKRLQEIIHLFIQHYPEARCALHFSNPEELLVATVLSAQCTDQRVNQVTAQLFVQYPHLMEDLAQASAEDLENCIRSTGFFRNKAKNLRLLAQKLVQEKNGKVPMDFLYLTQLPGVGRKTANVVMGNAFQQASGVVVDTHVQRLARRMGLTRSLHPEVIEKDLMALVPSSHWIMFPHWMIHHGRQVCKARKPNCQGCFLKDGLCPKKME